MAKIAFIGLGHMGGPMARNLLKAGHLVVGVDLVTAACDALKAAGGAIASSLAEAVEHADVVITMLPASEHVKEVYLGSRGVITLVQPGTLLIDSSTIDVATARLLNQEAAAKGLDMVDAPVSGGTAGAELGTLTFMVGGTTTAYEHVTPIVNSNRKLIPFC